MKNKLFLFLVALAARLSGASVVAAGAQEPADTLLDVRPFATHALDLLAGREAGVEVISTPGAPGMTPAIHVRGLGVLPGIPPVYVVDGMRRRDLEGIAPEAVERIEVLKDAAAMGLYGPEAAAGVVVVTTKRASQKGFHAGYCFIGGLQRLAHEPEKMTLADWQRYDNRYASSQYRDRDASVPETAFLQNHHLQVQYGGEKLSAYAGFSMLDDDGPYPGRADIDRRYAASWSAGYRPLEWLSMETTGRWVRNHAEKAPDGWLRDYLVSLPLYEYNQVLDYRYVNREDLSETTVQGKVEVRPLPGGYIRGTGEYARGLSCPYQATWTDYSSEEGRVSAKAGQAGETWYKWGVEAGWSGGWRGHHLRLDLSFRRMKAKQENRILGGTAPYADFGLSFGDDAHLEEKYLLPQYEVYKSTGGGIDGLIASKLSSFDVSSPERKWKEGVLSVGYDWKHRYQVDFSYFRLWEKTLFSGEGWRVPAVTLGWTLSEEPLLRRGLPEWWTDWSVKASWSRTDPYVPLLDDLGRWIAPDAPVFSGFTSGVSTAARHRDLAACLSFRFGGTCLDLSAAWYIHDDDLTRYYSYYYSGPGIESALVSGENDAYSLRNRGLELSGTVRGSAGPLRYGVSAHLAFYGNKVIFGEWLKDVDWFGWQKDSPLALKRGEPVGGAMLMPGDGSTYTDERVWKGSVFPKVTGGLRASLGWNRWQLTVSGHGDGGQAIRSTGNDPLTRHYFEDSPDHRLPDYLYQSVASLLDASFFRIDQLRLDYTLPLRNAVRLNLFASLENGILFTRYPGSDPELALHWDGLGVETATYPSTRRMLFGLKVGF